MINEPLVKSRYFLGNTNQPLRSAADPFCLSSEAKWKPDILVLPSKLRISAFIITGWAEIRIVKDHT